MLGNTHVMIGIIFSEILYVVFIQRKSLKNGQAIYARPLMWLWGAIGGWSPDMDSGDYSFKTWPKLDIVRLNSLDAPAF